MADDRRYKVFTLKNIQAPAFTMTALELKEYINFTVKRVYCITSPKGEMKSGNHAHRAEEDELFVQLQGQSTIVVDDGHGLEDVVLSGPQNAISVPHMVWHGFKDMSQDCVIVAITSTNYDPARTDYCENYEEFKELLLNKVSPAK